MKSKKTSNRTVTYSNSTASSLSTPASASPSLGKLHTVNYLEANSAVNFSKHSYASTLENIHQALSLTTSSSNSGSSQKEPIESIIQQMRFKINKALTKFAIELTDKTVTAEHISQSLFEYSDSLQKLARSIPNGYKTDSYEMLLLKYNLALAHYLNNCPNSTIKTLKSTIRRCETSLNTPVNVESRGNDSEVHINADHEQYELLLSQAKQLYCEALLEVDELATARTIISSEIRELDEGKIATVTNIAKEIMDVIDMDSSCSNKSSENVKQLIVERKAQLKKKREKVELTWRFLYTRLALKEKNSDIAGEQILKSKKLDERINQGSIDRDNQQYRFFMAHVEFINGNRLKARALLRTMPTSLENHTRESLTSSDLINKLQTGTRYLNNLAIIDMCEGNIHSAMLSFSKAYEYLQHCSKTLTFTNISNKVQPISNSIQIAKKTSLSICYNFAIANLFNGNYLKAFEILSESVIPSYPTSPRAWLRLAQCCIAAHIEATAEQCTFQHIVIDESSNKSVSQLTNLDSSLARTHHEDLSLEYAASAIRNTLRLLVRYEAKTSNLMSSTSMSCKPGGPLTNSGHYTLKTHALLAGSYIQLQLQNWMASIEYADQVLKSNSEDCYIYWLCTMYQATASLHLGRDSECLQMLHRAVNLVMSKENFEDWQSQLYDNTGISNAAKVGTNGGLVGITKLPKKGTMAGQSILLSDMNEWRILNLTNLAAFYCIQGRRTEAIDLLENIQMYLTADVHDTGYSLSRQQFESIRTYASLTGYLSE